MRDASAPFSLGIFARQPGQAFLGVVRGRQVVPLPALFAEGAGWPGGPLPQTLFDLLQDWPAAFRALVQAVGDARRWDALSPMDWDTLAVLPPLPQARQIVCTGANYRKHVIDLVAAQGAGGEYQGMTPEERRAAAARRVDERAAKGLPYAFPKLSSALCGPRDDLVVPKDATQLDWELELGVVIGRTGWRVPRERALDIVAGYMIVNDVTRRELVYREDMRAIGTDWLRSKSGPGFMPHGPLFVPAAFIPDPHQLHLRLEVNGQVMQDETTADMMFGVERQIEYLTAFVRLGPGDIVATGSPAGNGMHHGRFLQAGDVMRGSITGLGEQINRCIPEEA